MPFWVALVALVVSNVALRALVAAVHPEAATAWTTPHLLTWVFWFVVVVPSVLVGWSRVDDSLRRRRLRTRLDAWLRERGPAAALGEALVEAGELALLREFSAALEPRRGEPAVAAFIEATQRYLAASEFGSGAFRADGWASLGLQEARSAVKQAASALD
jgi:hypothetical protein